MVSNRLIVNDRHKTGDVLFATIVHALRLGILTDWLSDFDGTLNSDDPLNHDQPRIEPEALSALQGFADTPGLSAAIHSARPVEFFRDIPRKIDLYGSNGLEGRHKGEPWHHRDLDEGIALPLLTALESYRECRGFKMPGDPRTAFKLNKAGMPAVFTKWYGTGVVFHLAQANGTPMRAVVHERVERLVEWLKDSGIVVDPPIRMGSRAMVCQWADRDTVRFDYPIPGVDKGSPIATLKAAGRRIIFTGDGTGDVAAARLAHLTIAVGDECPRELLDLATAVLPSAKALGEVMNSTIQRIQLEIERDSSLELGANRASRVEVPKMEYAVFPWELVDLDDSPRPSGASPPTQRELGLL